MRAVSFQPAYPTSPVAFGFGVSLGRIMYHEHDGGVVYKLLHDC